MFRRAQADAESGRLRVHGSTSPAPLIVRDLSLNTVKEVAVEHLSEFLDIPLRGIVEDILGGNRFAVLVPERLVMLRVAVNGVRPLSPNDRLGQEAMAFCAQHYLNREIEFCVREVDRSGGYISNMCLLNGDDRVDIATALLSQGLAEIHDRTAEKVRDDPKRVADLEPDSSYWSDYREKEEDIPHTRNNWVCYDFKERRIVPTHYAIRTNGTGPGYAHLKSWLVETSKDGKS
jgi:hypothetical protein